MDREREREKHERERERERERQEKQRAEQEVRKHFEESLKHAHQKVNNIYHCKIPTRRSCVYTLMDRFFFTLQKDTQSGSWNLVTFPTIQRSSNGPDDDRKRVEDHHQQRHLSAASRHERNYYSGTTQRPPSVPSKTEYPPPAHSRVPTTKSSEKIVSGHPTMQKAEVNMFGYPAYQPTAFFPQEPKSKSDHHHKSSSQPSGLVVTKNSGISDRDRDMLTNQSALMNEHKSSVIVKLEGKTPHHIDSRTSVSHSQSPKLQQDMMRHYLPVGSQTHKGLYEYRSPTQSPHHLQHAPSPHHSIETQSIGKSSHHRSNSGQLPSPHHHRQSPHSHSQGHPSAEVRYRSVSESQSMIYQPSVKGSAANYSYMATMTPYTVVGNTVSNSKPKVSSPAPHIYGKPSPGVGNNIPYSRGHESPAPNSVPLASKPPLSSSVSPSPYQQVSHYLSPPPHPTSMPTCLPPPAHSSKPMLFESRMYPPGNSVPGGLSVKPSIQHGTSPPTAASAPSPISRSHPQYTIPGNNFNSQMIGSQSVQTAPLDLGVSSNKYESATSPKRKATPMNSVSSGPVCLDIKKRRIEQPPTAPSPQSHSIYGTSSQPQLARVSEPSPLIASAATTITTVVNTAAYRGTPNTTTVTTPTPVTISESLPEISVTTVLTDKVTPNVMSECQTQTNVVNLTTTTATTTITTPTNLTTTTQQQQPQPAESPSNTTTTSSTTSTATTTTITTNNNTPVKTTVPPSTVDSEKSNSPGPSKSQTSYPVRHLKKAWLQRHTGEDLEDNTGITGSGSCVTLPMNINNGNQVTTKEPPVTSLHTIGTMAVNSINKGKHFSSKQNNRKGAHKDSTSLNGHQDTNKGDDSSSSDAERGRKSPPKRKPPKVKRKKGGGAQKKNVDDHKKRKVGTQSVTVSESGSESEKESGSEKDSDSGASTTITTKKPGNNPTKEPRKRGRRPKSSKNDKGEEPRTKKSRDDSMPPRDPIRKPPVGQLKKTGESFLQDGPCHEVAPKLAKCRECRMTPNQRSKNMPNIFCRFYAFRRLRYTKNGQLAIAGFSDPHKDALEVFIIVTISWNDISKFNFV